MKNTCVMPITGTNRAKLNKHLSVLTIIYRQHDRPTAGEVAAGGQPYPTAEAGVQWPG